MGDDYIQVGKRWLRVSPGPRNDECFPVGAHWPREELCAYCGGEWRDDGTRRCCGCGANDARPESSDAVHWVGTHRHLTDGELAAIIGEGSDG